MLTKYTTFAPEAIVIARTLISPTWDVPGVAAVRRTVERIIESDPAIRTGLQRGIINSRALSRYLLENCAVDSTPDAVLGILRRYPLDGAREDDNRLAFKDCNISMRSGMAYLTIDNAPEIMKRVGEFASTIRSVKGESFRVIVGSDSVRVIAGQEALDKFRQTFRPREIINFYPELAEICLLLPFGTERLGEIATAITSQLTLNKIGLIGILVCPPEDIIIVSETDASRTFEALQQLLKEEGPNHPPKTRRTKNGLSKPEKLLEILRFDESLMSPILAA